MAATDAPRLFLVREPEPLTNFIRPHSRDISHLTQLIASGRPTGDGVIIDGRFLDAAAQLRDLSKAKGMEVVVDPQSAEMATPLGFDACSKVELPWLPRTAYSKAPLSRSERRALSEKFAEKAAEFGATAVFAPTSMLGENPIETLADDVEAAVELKRILVAAGSKIRVLYPLTAKLAFLSEEKTRPAVIALLQQGRAEIDSIWLRLSGLGFSECGPLNLRRYVGVARALHSVGVPVIGDRAGFVGYPLLAIGALAGVSSGITLGERYDLSPFFRKKSGKRRMPAPRVYVPALGLFLPKDRAETLLKAPSLKHWLTCNRSSCCARGYADMVGDPRRHFVVSRAEEIQELARVPGTIRPSHFLDSVRSASDRATAAMKVDTGLERHRGQLDNWRVTLSTMLEEDARVQPTLSLSFAKSSLKKGA